MVIDYLDIDRAGRAFGPFEADPPLIVDADAVLAPTVAMKRFQSIAAKGGEILQAARRLKAVKPEFGLS
jgi:hypothetical protein